MNGVSTPIFGISWSPPTADVAVARKVIAFVETRRVLFSTYTNEGPEECVTSVLDIRGFLSDIIGHGGIAAELLEPVRLMRRDCVRFLERVGANEDPRDTQAARATFSERHTGTCTTIGLGKRSVSPERESGFQLAIIAASYGLDIENELARTLPEPEPN